MFTSREARRASTAAALAAALSSPLPCHPAADTPAALEEIVVSARRILSPGLGAETLDAAALLRRRAATSDTASLLTALPGVSLYGAGGVSGLPSIRGLADDRLRTQVDGMDVVASCPNHMNSPLSYIDPTAVASVDVYSGVSPVSVGGDSIGGSIVVRSADPEFAASGEALGKGEAGTFFRSGADSWGGNLAATYATERLSLNYTGSYVTADNYSAGDDYRDYTFTGRAGHALARNVVGSTAYESSNQAVEIAWQRDGQLVDFTYGRQDVPQENYPNQRMDMTDNVSNQYNLAYTGRFDWGTLRARTYLQDIAHEMDFGPDKRFWYGPGAPPAGSGGDAALDGTPCSPISGTRVVNGKPVGCAAGMPMKTDGRNAGLSMNAAIPVLDDDLVRAGAEYQRFRLDDWWSPSGAGMWPYRFLNLNDGERDRYAAYVETEIQGGRWRHIAGVRFETVAMDTGPVHGYNLDEFPTSGTGGMGNQTRDAALFNAQSRERTDHNWDLSWIARYEPTAGTAVELGLAQKTRSPNLYERYAWSTWQMPALMNNFVGDGNGYIGNVDLEPEVARTASLTFAWHDADDADWQATATPYYSIVRDYVDAIQWDAATNAPRTAPVADNFAVLRYLNAEARLYGVDFSGRYRHATGSALGTLELQLVASIARGENLDTDDRLYNVMPPNATLGVTQESGRWHNTIEGEFAAPKDRVSGVRNEMPTAGYGLLNLRSRYELDSWRLEVGVENALDRFYDLPLGGAYVGQGTTMTIPPEPNQPQWGTPVPGPGRSVYAAASLRF
jgi:iron complex outermembrane receptor protein